VQFSLRKLFLLTTVVAVISALLGFILPLGLFATATFLLAPLPFAYMLRGWRLQAQGQEERGSNYVAIGLLLLLIVGPIILMSLLAMTMYKP
jgi:hypothetical protein